MRFLRAQAFLASALGVVAIAGCGGRGDLRTDLRPEGPPEVTAVLVTTDHDITDSAFLPGLGGLPEELATYCAVNDDKKPTYVGAPDFSVVLYCPEEAEQVPMVTTASVNGFLARVVFDELLDTGIETLHDLDDDGPCDAESINCYGSLLTTQPVTLTCNNMAVGYDGYYVPNGNVVSYPPGPSLVVFPTEFVATGATCSLTLRDTVVDKTGVAVEASQRGPYMFQLAGMEVIGTSPESGDDLASDAPVIFSFNAPLDATTVDAADFSVNNDTTGTATGFDLTVDGGDVIITRTGGTPWAEGDTYTVTLLDTATISDIGGGTYAGGEVAVTFTAVAP